MSNLIVTGKTGTPHITSADDGALNAGIIGHGDYILDVGGKMAPTLQDANTVVIDDGSIVMQGRHARIPDGESVEVNIDSGELGKNRIDIIVAEYTKEGELESVELKAVKGTAISSSAEPEPPELIRGSILEGGEQRQVGIAEVRLSGLTPTLTDKRGAGGVYAAWAVSAVEMDVWELNAADLASFKATQMFELSDKSHIQAFARADIVKLLVRNGTNVVEEFTFTRTDNPGSQVIFSKVRFLRGGNGFPPYAFFGNLTLDWSGENGYGLMHDTRIALNSGLASEEHAVIKASRTGATLIAYKLPK